jgi:hypothetical protein
LEVFLYIFVWTCPCPNGVFQGGYKLNLQSLKNCGGGSDILQLDDDFTSALTPECQVKPKGCITTTQDIQQAMVF